MLLTNLSGRYHTYIWQADFLNAHWKYFGLTMGHGIREMCVGNVTQRLWCLLHGYVVTDC